MRRTSNDMPEPPFTHAVNVEHALATLSYGEMVALAELFESWAFNDPALDDDFRTACLLWAVDYERIAEYCGDSWEACDDEEGVGLVPFIARRALTRGCCM